ncbi:MAG: phosphoribosylglycinamide formyltransferase [Chloroflexi bacterium]|nr:MAG: phosphoribosylglycinamide formyltransferase [Chloroflexota bacterium]
MNLRLGFLASYNGSSMQAICAAIQAGQLHAEARVVISNNSQSHVLAFARKIAIPAYHLSLKTEHTAVMVDCKLRDTLLAHEVNLVILSGYMKKLGPQTLAAYKHRILNIHPALLPKFGGQGMYGDHIHAAVLAAQEPETGITIHLVDEYYDHGPIIAQRRLPVFPTDTTESLALRVKTQEGAFFVEVLQQLAEAGLPQIS